MVSIETADNALKSFYLDAVTEALNYKANPFLAQIEQSTSNVVGKDVKKLVKCHVNGGVMGGSETGDLPVSKTDNRLVLTASLKNLYGTIQISDKAIRASANNEGAFVNLLNDEMQSLINSASYNFGRMVFGDGNGYLTTVNGEITEDAVVVNDISDLSVGMTIDFYNDEGNILEDYQSVVIREIDVPTKKVYFNTDTDFTESLPQTARLHMANMEGYELTGLQALFSQKDIYGHARSESPALQPYIRRDMSYLDVNVIQVAIDEIEQASGGTINFIICSWGVRRALMKYFVDNSMPIHTMELPGGFKAISLNGVPVIADRFCPKGTMYLLNTNDFKVHQLCDWKWLEGEDGKILKQVPGKPVYTATLVKYAELMCERPNGQGMICGIDEE